MSLGSFLGSAGLATQGAAAGAQYTDWLLDSEKDQQAKTRMRRATDLSAAQDAEYLAQPRQQFDPASGMPAPVPVPVPAPAPAPAAPVASAAPPAAGVAPPPASVPSGSPIAGVDVSALANPQVGTYGKPPPATVLTAQQADQGNRWLTSADARTFFTNNPGAMTAFQADPAKWVRDVLIPGKAQGLYAGAKADPFNLAKGGGTAAPGIVDTITQHVLPHVPANLATAAALPVVMAGALPITMGRGMGVLGAAMEPANAGTDTTKGARVTATQKKLARALGTVGGTLIRDAQQAAAPGVSQPPQTPYDPVVSDHPALPAPVAAGVAQTVAQGKPPSAWYLGNPHAIDADTNNAVRMREFLSQRARILAQARTPESVAAADALIPKVQQADEQIAALRGMQGIIQMGTYNDPRLLAGYLSYKSGVLTDIVPRQDGTWNMVAHDAQGQSHIITEGITSDQLGNMAHRIVDKEWAATQDKAAADQAAADRKEMWNTTRTNLDNAGRYAVAELQGNSQIWNTLTSALGQQGLERIKQNGQKSVSYNPQTGEPTIIIGDKVFTIRSNTIQGPEGPITSRQLEDVMDAAGYSKLGGPGLNTSGTFPGP